MELVDHPSKVEKPETGPWVKRLKYTAVAELLSDYEASNAAIGRAYCPVSDYFRAHLNEPLEDVESYVYQHPQWGPAALCETIYRTLLFNHAASHPHGEYIAAWVQHFCAVALTQAHPFAQARHAVSEMLKHPEMRFVSPEAQTIIRDYVANGHPNPGRFFAKPEVLANFPDLNPADYPAPDFPNEDQAA